MQTRRNFLIGAGATALLPMMGRLTLAAAPGDYRLAVIVLRGAVDAIDVCRPTGDPAFAALRPDEAKDHNIPLDGRFAMHPAMAPLEPLFRQRQLSFIQAVATPYRERSHFEGQDILEQGSKDRGLNNGWLNRMLDLIPGVKAVDIGAGESMLLSGPHPVKNWYPEIAVDLQADSLQFLVDLYAEDPILARALAGIEDERGRDMVGGDSNRGVSNVEVAALAARFLKEEARIAAFSIGGWDTHRQQAGRLKRLLGELSQCILALRDGLGSAWARTAVVMCTEFGRTVRYNGTAGTDHGTGGLAMIAGGLLANGEGGKVLGKWPGLADLYQDRDLMPTSDVRLYLGSLSASLFGISPSLVTSTMFPGLDLAAPIKLI